MLNRATVFTARCLSVSARSSQFPREAGLCSAYTTVSASIFSTAGLPKVVGSFSKRGCADGIYIHIYQIHSIYDNLFIPRLLSVFFFFSCPRFSEKNGFAGVQGVAAFTFGEVRPHQGVPAPACGEVRDDAAKKKKSITKPRRTYTAPAHTCFRGIGYNKHGY